MTVLCLAAAPPAAAAPPLPQPKPAHAATMGKDAAPLPVGKEKESYDLPPYAMGDRIGFGKMGSYRTDEEDTLLDVARHFGFGYVEIRAANPDIDPWAPLPGSEVVLPSFHLLPRAPQRGVVVNLAEMRMYYFRTPGAQPETFPLGIGKDGLQTPTGETTVVRKVAGPTWRPTPRMREEKPYLPEAVPPGPSNPLGTHALYLGWPTFLIHGSNKPWAIGRRVSSGCMRMYPEDIRKVYNLVPVGTPVTVVDQPVLVGWVDGTLYLEAHPTKAQSNQIEIEGVFDPVEMTAGLEKFITKEAGDAARHIDWRVVEKALRDRAGYPVAIARAVTAPAAPQAAPQYNN